MTHLYIFTPMLKYFMCEYYNVFNHFDLYDKPMADFLIATWVKILLKLKIATMDISFNCVATAL